MQEGSGRPQQPCVSLVSKTENQAACVYNSKYTSCVFFFFREGRSMQTEEVEFYTQRQQGGSNPPSLVLVQAQGPTGGTVVSAPIS